MSSWNHEDLTFTANLGRAISVARDSDRNNIHDNRITANLSLDNIKTYRAPGPDLPSNRPAARGGAVVIGQMGPGESTLLSALVEGRLYQYSSTSSQVINADFTENNKFDRNTITLTGAPVDGLVLSVTSGNTVSNNEISGAGYAIRVGIQTGPSSQKIFPGSCTRDPNVIRQRPCLGSDDCNILGFDSTNIGPCSPPITRNVSWVANNNTMEYNTIRVPKEAGITVAGSDTKIRLNTIRGPLSSSGLGGILLVGKYALENSTVTGNIVSDVDVGLKLTKVFQGQSPSTFGARISLNDFVGYTRAVLTVGSEPPNPNIAYDLPTDLTFLNKGNFWRTPCTVGLVSQNPLVTDNHPYTFPVAKRVGGLVPLPCR